jgi:WD40 repeat protein
MSVALNRDGTRLAIGGRDRTVKLWDLESGQEVLTLRGHTDMVTGVAFSGDDRLLAPASLDGTVLVRDATPWDGVGGETTTVHGHGDTPLAGAYSPDGRRLAWTVEGGLVEIHDTETGREVLRFQAHPAPVIWVSFSPDGKRLVTAGWDKTVKVWDATSGALLLGLNGHTPVGYRGTGEVKLWDMAKLVMKFGAR